MSETPPSCPFIGLAGDRTVLRTVPDDAHRCYALRPPGSPDAQHQQGFCLSKRHTQCPFYQSPDVSVGLEAESAGGRSRAQRWLATVAWCLLAALIGWVAFVYLRDTSPARSLSRALRPQGAALTAIQRPASQAAVAMVTSTPGRSSAPAAGRSPTPALAVAAIDDTPATPTPSPENSATTTMTPAPTETVPATAIAAPAKTSRPATASPTKTRVRTTATPKASAVARAAKVQATPTRSSASPTPTAPASICPDPRVQITAPQPGAAVAGVLELRGRAVHEAFAAYVIEVARGAQPSGGYDEVLRSETAVEDGVLGAFVLAALPKGTYTVSLGVLTSQGDPPPPCRVVYQVSGR